jgi:hypothetical protein
LENRIPYVSGPYSPDVVKCILFSTSAVDALQPSVVIPFPARRPVRESFAEVALVFLVALSFARLRLAAPSYHPSPLFTKT